MKPSLLHSHWSMLMYRVHVATLVGSISSCLSRPALTMIQEAERKGIIKPGDTLIEATSGNTGIALAMAAAIKGYEMILIMPSNMSEERRTSMAAYGAKLLSVSQQLKGHRIKALCSILVDHRKVHPHESFNYS